MIPSLERRFPYRTLKHWMMMCSVMFILSYVSWCLARYVSRYDILEIPMSVFFFPFAFFLDPHEGMLHMRQLTLYALTYWGFLFYASFLISRQRVNPVVPALLILMLSSVASIGYAIAVHR